MNRNLSRRWVIDEDLLEKYPGIDNVAGFLGETSRIHYKNFGCYNPFDDLGVKNEDEFLKLVEFGNKKAVGLYLRIKEIFCF
ncbi:MAG: hypothetical protein AABX77_00490 [Nanoarchaeota archaeon]